MQKNTLPIFELGNDFYDTVTGGNFTLKKIRFQNQTITNKLIANKNLPPGILTESEWLEYFGKFKPLDNNLPQALALRYHGHQFQNYNSELGDGRGFLYAQFLEGKNLFELGSKGSGTTPYSRKGDGRLTLKGAIREALCTAYLQFQSINTSKTFSIIETNEQLIRYDEPSPTRSSILLRYSHGHIRIGSFQRQLFYQHKENINKLTSYCLKYFYPYEELYSTPEADLLRLTTWRLADLVASYMIGGFVHGVLNTDNINVSGESFDYGPYRFLPKFDPHFTAAYFDHEGLYCYGNQPSIFLWNLEQFKKCLAFANSEIAFDLTLEFSKYLNFHLIRRFLKKLKVDFKVAESETNSFLNNGNSPEKNNGLKEENYLFPFKYNREQINFVLNSVNFKVGQQLLELFFAINETVENLNFEESFFYFTAKIHGIENAVTRKWDPTFQNHDLVKSFFQFFQNHFTVSSDLASQEKTRAYFLEPSPQTLLIDEIEAIWDAIDNHDNWKLFEDKLKVLAQWNTIYNF